jgi:ATP-dependent DNA helicase RecG
MIDEMELLKLMGDLESFRVERTASTSDTQKFSEAVCAFANDMAGAGLPGFLLIGVNDNTGNPTGLAATDQLLQMLAGLSADGNILPPPALVAYRITLSSGKGDVAVVEVQPSDIPPVRYKGVVRIRRGPRKAIANESEERILAERRVAGHVSYDAQPCSGSTLADLALDLFTTGYRSLAVDSEVIAENNRPIEVQLATLRFYDLNKNCPTHAGMLLFGKNPLYYEQHAYLQYVHYDGIDQGADVASERQFSGDLLTVLRELDSFVKSLPTTRPVEESALRERLTYDYPPVALRELLMNAVMHRAYDQPSPIRTLHFRDRVEITSPGPLYGLANASNFPRQTSYRNPVIAEAMKVLGFVNRFGRGVERAQMALKDNGSTPAQFEFGDTFFGVSVSARP